MTDEKRRSYTDSEREKMDRGASMIPDAVENLWLAKRHLVNLRDMLLAGNLEAARRLGVSRATLYLFLDDGS